MIKISHHIRRFCGALSSVLGSFFVQTNDTVRPFSVQTDGQVRPLDVESNE